MHDKEKIIQLRNKTNCSIKQCKEALLLADGLEDIAYEFLRLKYSGVSRKKNVNGKLVPWDNRDYILAAINKHFED